MATYTTKNIGYNNIGYSKYGGFFMNGESYDVMLLNLDDLPICCVAWDVTICPQQHQTVVHSQSWRAVGDGGVVFVEWLYQH